MGNVENTGHLANIVHTLKDLYAWQICEIEWLWFLDAASWPRKYEGIDHSICTACQVGPAVYTCPLAVVGLIMKDNKEMNSGKLILGSNLSWTVK